MYKFNLNIAKILFKLCTALTLTYCSDGGRSKNLGGYIDKVKAGFFCFEKFLSILSDLHLTRETGCLHQKFPNFFGGEN